MEDKLLEHILYGTWRPWIKEGPEKFLDAREIRSRGTSDSYLRLYYDVETPDPEGRRSLTYDEYIANHLRKWHVSAVQSIDEVEGEEDRWYRYKVAKGDLLSILRAIPDLRQYIQHHPEEKENPLSRFVLEVVSLRLANLLMDLEQRYPELTEQFHSEEEIYLRLLDRRPPNPSPHQKAITWFREQSRKYLQELTDDEKDLSELIGQMRTVMQELYERLIVMSADDPDYRSMTDLLNHLENALFLRKMKASFLDRHSERLAEHHFCSEWVQQMISDLITGEDDIPAHERLQQLDRVSAWFDRWLDYPYSGGREVPLSETGRWFLQVEQLADMARHDVLMTSDEGIQYKTTPDSGLTDEEIVNPFVDFFRSKYVHKQDVEAVMGIGNKTLTKYLDMAKNEIEVLTLKQNVWYDQNDLKQFLEENTDYLSDDS